MTTFERVISGSLSCTHHWFVIDVTLIIYPDVVSFRSLNIVWCVLISLFIESAMLVTVRVWRLMWYTVVLHSWASMSLVDLMIFVIFGWRRYNCILGRNLVRYVVCLILRMLNLFMPAWLFSAMLKMWNILWQLMIFIFIVIFIQGLFFILIVFGVLFLNLMRLCLLNIMICLSLSVVGLLFIQSLLLIETLN